MQPKVTVNTKNAFYMSETEALEKSKQYMRENGGVTKDDLDILLNFVGGTEILKAEAEYAKNANAFDQFGTDTGMVDIWIKITTYDHWKTFKIVGAYLSDIWQIGAMDRSELESRMFIRTFAEQ